MIALSVTIDVHPGKAEEFWEIVQGHAKKCLEFEEGCLLFEVARHEENKNRFFFFEKYKTEKDLREIHKATPHFAVYLEKTPPLVAHKVVEVWKM